MIVLIVLVVGTLVAQLAGAEVMANLRKP